ncbi:MAG: hypothetical protein AUG09_01515 [Acidobacteria bacterium 13_1_20CM_2_68_7]|nr:MAG: hypothetical protein AUG09_01515 [Acidobacteria bacterium 13_1_20CM_2_68_7]
MRAALLLLIAGATLAAGTGTAGAQTATTTQAVYRLSKDSDYQQGCFAPCMCPVMISSGVTGTFILTPAGFDGLFTTYAVTEVNWIVSLNGTDTFVTGSGTYKVGGEFALQQELALDLQVGDGAVQHFDSGLTGATAPFPDIDLTISVNKQTCFDTVFRVSASPVPPDQIRPYRLVAGSTFQRGCFGACACAAGPKLPIAGTFALVPLVSTPLWNNYAVINVRWRAFDSSTAGLSSSSIPVRGFGTRALRPTSTAGSRPAAAASRASTCACRSSERAASIRSSTSTPSRAGCRSAGRPGRTETARKPARPQDGDRVAERSARRTPQIIAR